MVPDRLFHWLDIWVARGWLRPLERAFVHFLDQTLPQRDGLALLSAALVSYQVGRGHICLDLALALSHPGILPPEQDTAETATGVTRPGELLQGLTRPNWEHRLLQSGLVNRESADTPLVLHAGRLYLRRYWQYEQQVARRIAARIGRRMSLPPNLAARLDVFFDNLRSPAERDRSEIHWQSVAAVMAAGTALSIISGGPGTGKTTTVVRLLGMLQQLALEQGPALRIRLATPTGKAAARLTESIGTALHALPPDLRQTIPTEAATLHRLLGSRPNTRHFIHNARNPLHLDVLIVDEASMIDLEMMTVLLEALPPEARLILLGDKDQLASVEAGAVLGDLCREAAIPGYHPDTVNWLTHLSGYDVSEYRGRGSTLAQHICLLRKSHRFGNDSGIGALALAVNSGDTAAVNTVWQSSYRDIVRLVLPNNQDVRFARLVLDGYGDDSDDTTSASGYREYLQYLQAGPGSALEADWMMAVLHRFSRFQVLTALRQGDWGVTGLNARIAAILLEAGLIPAAQGWYAGRPVLVTRNDYSLGLMNGDIGIALPLEDPTTSSGTRLGVVFAMPDGSLKTVRPSRLHAVETVYAMTVHKAQGSEFDHTVLVLPEHIGPLITRELVYTGITRARRRFTLVAAHATSLTQAVQQRTRRASGLGDLLAAQAAGQESRPQPAAVT